MLVDALKAELPFLRLQAESLMVETVTVSRGGGAPVFDPDTGDYVPPAPVTLYVGPGQVRRPSAVEVTVLFGERQVTTTRQVISLPWTATGFQVGDVATVQSDHPDLVMHRFQVVATPDSSFPVSTNLGVEVVDE